MTYLEYLKKEIEATLVHLSDINRTISEANKKGVNYLDYGSRNEILMQYLGKRKGRISLFLSRVSDQKLNDFILNRELESLKKQKDELEEKLHQYKLAEKSFLDGVMTEQVFPNNYVLKSMLTYFCDTNANEYNRLLRMMISMFKFSERNNTNFLAIIEGNIAENFDENYELKEKISIDSLLFMIDKILKSLNLDEKMDPILESLKKEIKNSYLSLKNKTERKEDQSDSYDEVREYIVDGKVVKTTPNLQCFNDILNKTGINEETKEKYLELMQNELEKRESIEDKRLVEKYLSAPEEKTIVEAYNYLMGLSNPMIVRFIKRILKDVVSACKYMEVMGKNLDMQETYETITCNIELLRTICAMDLSEEQENYFYYVLGTDEMPVALRNIEGIDPIKYTTILKLLKDLVLHKCGTEISCVDGLSLNTIEENNVGIIYAKKEDTIIILGITADMFSKENPTFNENMIKKIKDILSKTADPEFKKTHAIYESALCQIINLNSLSSDLEISELKKKK